MDSNIVALQGLYVALGGDLTDTYEDIADGAAVGNYVVKPDVIEAIAKKASAALEGVLPKVTSSDNGKVLTVVSGKWAKADLPE